MQKSPISMTTEGLLNKDRQENIKKIFNQSKEMRISANQDILFTLKQLNQEQEQHRQFQEKM